MQSARVTLWRDANHGASVYIDPTRGALLVVVPPLNRYIGSGRLPATARPITTAGA